MRELIALTSLDETGKFEIRISPDFIKLVETNSNDQNTNNQNFGALLFWILNIRVLRLFRISHFDIRIF